MRRVERLLAVFVLLAGPVRAGTLEVEIQPQASSVERAVVNLVVDLAKDGVSCAQSSLTLEGPELSKPPTPKLEKCEVQGKRLTATASFLRSPDQLVAVFQACVNEKQCETYRRPLPESAGALNSWPLILQKVETARGELVFQSRELPPEFGEASAVRLVEWEPAEQRPAGRPPVVSADATRLTFLIPMDCTSLELSKTALTQAGFEIRDSKGFPLRFAFEGALPLCGEPPSWFSRGRFWLPASGACVALLGLLGGMQLGKRYVSKPEAPPVSELPSWLKESVNDLSEKVGGGFQELKACIDRLERPPTPARPPGMPIEEETEEPEPQSFTMGQVAIGHERELLQAVNDWWGRGDSNKEALVSRISQNDAKLYVSFDTDATLQRMVGRMFSFRPSDGPAGWVWYPLSKGEALAVPADPFLFQAGNMIEVLRLLFDGIGDGPKNFRFFRVHKACRLRVQTPGSDRYQLVEKGYLELADRSGSRIPGPPPPARKALSTGATPPSRKGGGGAPEPSVTPGPSLREIEDGLRWVLKDELGRFQPPQAPTQPVDHSREAIKTLQGRIDGLSLDLRKLDSLQQSLEGFALRIESLKQTPIALPMLPAVSPTKRADLKAPPASVPPVPRVEAARLLDIPPAKVASEPSPGEFLKRVSQALPTLVTAASEPPGSPAPSDYLRRLFSLWKDLHQTRADQGWKLNLLHLQVARISERERIFSVHPVKVYEDFREAKCLCGDLPEAFLLQIFLAVRNEGDLMGVAMASSNMAERFAEGYSLLTGDENPRDKGNLVMTRPAVLQNVRGSSESWRVVLPMEVELR